MSLAAGDLNLGGAGNVGKPVEVMMVDREWHIACRSGSHWWSNILWKYSEKVVRFMRIRVCNKNWMNFWISDPIFNLTQQKTLLFHNISQKYKHFTAILQKYFHLSTRKIISQICYRVLVYLIDSLFIYSTQNNRYHTIPIESHNNRHGWWKRQWMWYTNI